jgi:hypothetical protein
MIRTLLAVIAASFGMLLTIPIVVLGLPFWTVAFLTRTFCRLFEPHAVPWQQIIEFDPAIGWKPKPNLNTYCSFAAGVFRVKTDSQGWRGTANIAESEIVVFGDSYAFGYGVDDEKAFFSAPHSQLRIKAIGSPGYNMVQELILMHQSSLHLRDKLVVWFIYFGNDLYDNLLPNLYNYRQPFIRTVNGSGEWNVVTGHISRTEWPFNFEHNFRVKEKWGAVFGTTFLSHRVYPACEFLIRQAREICSHAGGRLVVMTIPWPTQLNQRDWEQTMSRFGNPKEFNPHLPDQKLSEICSKLGVPFVTGKDYLAIRDHIPGEGHWNERGHQRVAEVLIDLYQRFMLKSTVDIDLGDHPTDSLARYAR